MTYLKDSGFTSLLQIVGGVGTARYRQGVGAYTLAQFADRVLCLYTASTLYTATTLYTASTHA